MPLATTALKSRRGRVHRGARLMRFVAKKCLVWGAAVCAAVTFASCQPRDPLDMKISAGSAMDFERWFDRYDSRLAPESAQEFHQALEAVLRGTLTADNRNYGPGVRQRTEA